MKANLPRLINRLELGYDGEGHPRWAADQLTLREWGERVKKRNRRNAALVRLIGAGMIARRVHRTEEDRADLDVIKAPGRRFGPTPLRLLLPQEGRAARPLDTEQRMTRYARQGATQGAAPSVAVTPRQRRRIAHKRNRALRIRES